MVKCDAKNLTELRQGALEAGDWTVLVLYFLFCITVGLFVSGQEVVPRNSGASYRVPYFLGSNLL